MIEFDGAVGTIHTNRHDNLFVIEIGGCMRFISNHNVKMARVLCTAKKDRKKSFAAGVSPHSLQLLFVVHTKWVNVYACFAKHVRITIK